FIIRLRAAADERSQPTVSARMPWRSVSSAARAARRSLRRATSVTPRPRSASSRAIAAPIPDDAPVTREVDDSLEGGSDIGRRAYRPTIRHVASEEDPFGGLFGDPEELRRRMAELAEQM